MIKRQYADSTQTACAYGAPAIFEVIAMNPKEGKFSAKYTSPSVCFGMVEILFKIPYRETNQSKTEIHQWTKVLEQSEKRIAHASNHATVLMNTLGR